MNEVVRNAKPLIVPFAGRQLLWGVTGPGGPFVDPRAATNARLWSRSCLGKSRSTGPRTRLLRMEDKKRWLERMR